MACIYIAMSQLKRPIIRSDVPIHIQVRERILMDIRSGNLKAGDQLPNEVLLASKLSVSRMTVNKAILSLVGNGFLHRVKGKGTFVCDHLSIQAATKCAVTISQDPLVALENDYFGKIYWRIHSVLQERGVETTFLRHVTGRSDLPADINGIISIAPTEYTMEDLAKFGRSGVPSVIIGADWRSDWISTVDSDNVLGAALAVTHLVRNGHRRLLFVGAMPEFSNTRDRERGFRLAAKAHQLESSDLMELMFSNAIAFSPAETQSLEQILCSPSRPTAIIAGGAAIAMHILATASRMGLSIPRHLSMVAYDDPAYLSMAYPPITTIRQPLAEMASRAADLLLEKILGGDPRAVHVSIDPQLIERESVDMAATQ